MESKSNLIEESEVVVKDEIDWDTVDVAKIKLCRVDDPSCESCE